MNRTLTSLVLFSFAFSPLARGSTIDSPQAERDSDLSWSGPMPHTEEPEQTPSTEEIQDSSQTSETNDNSSYENPSPTGPEANQHTPPPAMEVVSPQAPYGGDLEDGYDDEDYTPVGTEVTSSESSAEKARKKEFWTHIILATAAVIVAVVSIIVVSNNNGSSP